MHCRQCGNEVEQHARFCSKCGHELAPVRPVEVLQKSKHDMNMHIHILGWLFISCAVLVGIVGMVMIFAGQLIEHLPIVWPAEFPFGVVNLAGSLAVVAGLAILAIAAGVAAAGIGLLQYRSWGRVLAIVMSVLFLFKFPFGTAIAIYAFWVLFSEEGREHYQTLAARSAG
ncbi:MAG: hypothetical protein DMG13_08055 [Acidobacteria bacterium]|nr:MAG: hypothetical protein DMG13_08055 [Acidobacteriota bacterium]